MSSVQAVNGGNSGVPVQAAIQAAIQPLDQTMASKVASIVTSRQTQDLLNAYGLKAHSVTWEDTGRTKGSCWGPNISDMTLVVKNGNTLMPVIRKPNFSDVTVDVPIEAFNVNYKGSVKPLKTVLEELKVYDTRDTAVLTSSQCCVLPVELGSKTQFALQLFNYQSGSEPAVLVVLASKNGTSVQVLDSSNTKLFFDDLGTARWFTAERLEDVRIRAGDVKTKVDSFKEMKAEEKLDNTIMMIQIPLKRKQQYRGKHGAVLYGGGAVYGGAASSALKFGMKGSSYTVKANSKSQPKEYAEEEDCDMGGGLFDDDDLVLDDMHSALKAAKESKMNQLLDVLSAGSNSRSALQKKSRGMDMGQIGLGDTVGSYTGTRGHTLTRDANLPVRCTFQYYRVTDDGTLDEKSVQDIKEQLDQSLRVAVGHGSLVLNTTSGRVTEPILTPNPSVLNQPNPWANSQTMSSFM